MERGAGGIRVEGQVALGGMGGIEKEEAAVGSVMQRRRGERNKVRRDRSLKGRAGRGVRRNGCSVKEECQKRRES